MTPKDKARQLEDNIYNRLEKAFSSLNYNVIRDSGQNSRYVDFVVQNETNYRIGIELKSFSNLRESINLGIEQLKSIDEKENFNKLLLLIENNNNDYIKNKTLLNSIISSNVFFRENPTKLEVRLTNEIEEWIETLISHKNQDNQSEKNFNLIIRESCKALIKEIIRNPEMLREIEWFDFERTVAEVMVKLGFDVTLTRPSKDGGKDIILKCSIDGVTKSYIIELKHWKSKTKVGKDDVKKFTNVIVKEEHNKGLFLSTYGFNSNYCEYLTESETKIIQFGEKEKVVDLCKTYERINNGIWLPTNLEEILFEKTIKPI